MTYLAIIILFVALLGSALVVAGIYVLVGLGWSFIVAGLLLIAAAAFLRLGLTANG